MCCPFPWHKCEQSFLKRARALEKRAFWSSACTGNRGSTICPMRVAPAPPWPLPPLLVAASVTPQSLTWCYGEVHMDPLPLGPSASSQSTGNFTTDRFLSSRHSFANKSLSPEILGFHNLLSPLPYAYPRGCDHRALLNWGGGREENGRRGKIWFNVPKYHPAPFIWKYNFRISNNWPSSETLGLLET